MGINNFTVCIIQHIWTLSTGRQATTIEIIPELSVTKNSKTYALVTL